MTKINKDLFERTNQISLYNALINKNKVICRVREERAYKKK